MIVNMNLFKPGEPLQPHTLWVVEQMPGMCVSADETHVLNETSYWASYNQLSSKKLMSVRVARHEEMPTDGFSPTASARVRASSAASRAM